MGEAELGIASKHMALKGIWEALGVQKLVEDRDTVLIKGSWLVEWMKDGEPLPRRQDLPQDAIWDVEGLRKNVEEFRVFMVAISYAWADPEHPDPCGEQMRTVANIVEKRLQLQYNERNEEGRQLATVNVWEDAAIFIDWASLYQDNEGTS